MEYVRARNQTALILGSQQISYHELIHHSSSYAQLLEESPCEKVALLGENRLEWGYALYGAWQRGCVVIPLDAMASPEEIAYMLEDSRPEVLFSSREKLPTVQKALPELSYTPRILVFEELEKMPFQEQEHPETLSLEAPGHNTALIIYTSGTTGSPKGAMLSFENLRVNAEAVSSGAPFLSSPQAREASSTLRCRKGRSLFVKGNVRVMLDGLCMNVFSGSPGIFSPW